MVLRLFLPVFGGELDVHRDFDRLQRREIDLGSIMLVELPPSPSTSWEQGMNRERN